MKKYSHLKYSNNKKGDGRKMKRAKMKQQGQRPSKSQKKRHKKISCPICEINWLKNQKESIDGMFKVKLDI